MARAPSLFVVVTSSLLAAFVVASCGETSPNTENGGRCALNSDCKSPLVCGFERCRTQCNTSRDCNGRLCVRNDSQRGANVCQLEDEVECTHNSECPGTQLCGPDRHCRDVCVTDKDCVTDLLCVTRTCAKPEELEGGKLPDRAPADAGAHCTYATDCPGDFVCLYGSCDVECLGDKDCRIGWSCKPQKTGGDGRCYPNGATVDASSFDATAADSGDANSVADASSDAGDAAAADASDGGPTYPKPTAITVGNNNSCARFDNGKIKCWGFNSTGVLGTGDAADRGTTAGSMGDALPFVDVGTGRTVTMVRVGFAFHACALLDNGKVKCWGSNQGGALGIGDTMNRGDQANQMGDNLPYVDLGAGRTASAIAVGAVHNCAILDNGKVKCWGANFLGQLGLGDTTNRGDQANQMGDNLPYVDLGAGRTAKVIASSGHSTCAILDNDKLKCWGYGGGGGLGIGSSASRGASPGDMGDNLPYVDLGTGRSPKWIGTGHEVSCAVLDNDKLKCWGRNQYGMLGLGDTIDRGDNAGEMGDALPYIDFGTGLLGASIFTSEQATCALSISGKVKCWGNGGTGQLGTGDTSMRGVAPGQMGDALLPLDFGTGRSVKALSSGIFSGCAILDNDKIKCWGNGGALGTEDTIQRGGQPNQMGDNLPYVKLFGP